MDKGDVIYVYHLYDIHIHNVYVYICICNVYDIHNEYYWAIKISKSCHLQQYG